jgi:hypothetical protein
MKAAANFLVFSFYLLLSQGGSQLSTFNSQLSTL